MEDAKEKVISTLEEVSSPSDMSKIEYKELLEDLISDLQSRLESTEMEIDEEMDEL